MLNYLPKIHKPAFVMHISIEVRYPYVKYIETCFEYCLYDENTFNKTKIVQKYWTLDTLAVRWQSISCKYCTNIGKIQTLQSWNSILFYVANIDLILFMLQGYSLYSLDYKININFYLQNTISFTLIGYRIIIQCT